MVAEGESITDDLRDDILAGDHLPGTRLVELQLSEQYCCGRAAVRTALVELSTEGLVDRQANRGATVRDVSIAEVVQITEARAALESLIASEAAKFINSTQRDELRNIGSSMRKAVQTEDHVTYSELNSTLHSLIRDISKHVVAVHLVRHLRNRAARHQFKLAQVPGRPTRSLPEHLAIIDAIVAGNSAAAAEAMTAHLNSVVDALAHWNHINDKDLGGGAPRLN